MKRTTLSLLAFASALSLAGTLFAAGPSAPRTDDERKDVGSPATAPSPPAQSRPLQSPAPGTFSQSPATPQTAPGTAAQTPAASGARSAASPATAAANAKAPLPGTDQAFIQKAAELNQLETELCKAAERISANPEIRKAAQSILRDLTSARQQIETLAKNKGISLPTTLPQALQDRLTAAESRTAEQFDTAYLQDQIQNKQQVIALFERETTRTTDPDIKAWARQTLPNLKNHLAILKSTRLPAVGEKTNGKSQTPGNPPQKSGNGSKTAPKP